jgi:hypothetical protein
MTTDDREFDLVLRHWLEDGGAGLSDRVFTAVMADLSAVPQRRLPGFVRRWRARPATSRFAVVATVSIAIVALAGFGLILTRPGPTIGPAIPTPPANPSPSAASSAGPSPTDAPSERPSAAGRGTWGAIDGLRITFDLPSGWSQPGGSGSSDRYPTPHAQGPAPGVAVNFYDEVETVWQNPCRRVSVTSLVPPEARSGYLASGGTGTTPADLAAKLRSAAGYSATDPVDITLAGFHGKRLELRIPDSLADCDFPSGLALWVGRPMGSGSAGQRDRLWILDVAGKRVVIEAVSFPATSAEDLAAQQRLIDSIQIDRVETVANPVP